MERQMCDMVKTLYSPLLNLGLEVVVAAILWLPLSCKVCCCRNNNKTYSKIYIWTAIAYTFFSMGNALLYFGMDTEKIPCRGSTIEYFEISQVYTWGEWVYTLREICRYISYAVGFALFVQWCVWCCGKKESDDEALDNTRKNGMMVYPPHIAGGMNGPVGGIANYGTIGGNYAGSSGMMPVPLPVPVPGPAQPLSFPGPVAGQPQPVPISSPQPPQPQPVNEQPQPSGAEQPQPQPVATPMDASATNNDNV